MQEELSMDKEFIQKLYDVLEVNFENEQFGVNELSEEVGVSHSQLHRKLQSIEGKSASRFISHYRLQKALEMLQKNVATASEISYRVGFASPTYFNTCFREFYGFPPGEVKFRKVSAKKENEIFQNKKNLSKSNLIIISSFIIILLVTTYYFYNKSENKIASQITETVLKDKSIAVLPFKNLSDNNENQYFADGVMDVILNHLSSIKELKVISRTSMEHYRETTKTMPEIAKELDVSYILEGSVQKNNGEIRIITQLIDAKNDKHISSIDIKKDYKDIFELQSTIAKQISKELNTELSEAERNQIDKKPTNNLEAYNLYLKGQRFLNNGLTSKSMTYLEQAIKKDPEFALGYSELSCAYNALLNNGSLPSKKTITKIKELNNKAIDLDNSIGQPHHILANIMFRYEWNWKGAENELLTALNINPNNSTSHLLYSKFLNYTGRFEESREQINQALLLNPLYTGNYSFSALSYYYSGDYEKALIENKRALDISIKFVETNWLNFEIYSAQKKYDKAVSELKKLEDSNEAKEIDNIYTQFGIKGVYRWIIASYSGNKNYNTPFFLAQKHAFIGENEKALSLLEKSLELRISRMPEINREPNFKNLKSEPRFQKILKEMGLYDLSSDK